MEGTPREIDPIEFKTKLYNITHVVVNLYLLLQ
jgi:hypothetical protein